MIHLSVYPHRLSHALWNATQWCHVHSSWIHSRHIESRKPQMYIFPQVTFNLKIQMNQWRWMLFIYSISKMSLCLLFPALCCFVGRKNRGPRRSFADIDCLITFFTLSVQLWDLLCEAEEAFLSFLSFKCQLASEWPWGPPSSTLRNLLSVCKVLHLTRPQSRAVFLCFVKPAFVFW